MLKVILPFAALIVGSGAYAQIGESSVEIPPLTMEQQTNLRCALAFAAVSAAQDADEEWTSDYPAMDLRGKEFFVRTMAKIMEDERFTREVVSQLAKREGDPIIFGGRETVQEMMPACLALLDASGL